MDALRDAITENPKECHLQPLKNHESWTSIKIKQYSLFSNKYLFNQAFTSIESAALTT